MSANHLILDYVEICERRRELLNFAEFVDLWLVATEIAVEEVPRPASEPQPKPPELFFPPPRR